MLQYVVGTGSDNAARQRPRVRRAEDRDRHGEPAPRAVGTAEVRVGREKGYSVAATQRAGVGYLVDRATSIPTSSAQLAAMVYDER